MNVSIIIPLLNESESINELNEWIFKVLTNTDLEFEVIYIDDGSRDSSWSIIEEIAKSNHNVKGISFNKNYGKSQALRVGFSEAKGEYVATLDADLQDSPEEIPTMINKLIENNLDMISGWKKKRYDSFFLKRLPSSLFNFVAVSVSSISLLGLKSMSATLFSRAFSVVKSIGLKFSNAGLNSPPSLIIFPIGGLSSGAPLEEKASFGSVSIVRGVTSITSSAKSTSGTVLALETAALVTDLFSATFCTIGA